MLHVAELMGSSIPVRQNDVKGALPVEIARATPLASAGKLARFDAGLDPAEAVEAAISAILATRRQLNKVIKKHELTPKNV